MTDKKITMTLTSLTSVQFNDAHGYLSSYVNSMTTYRPLLEMDLFFKLLYRLLYLHVSTMFLLNSCLFKRRTIKTLLPTKDLKASTCMKFYLKREEREIFLADCYK